MKSLWNHYFNEKRWPIILQYKAQLNNIIFYKGWICGALGL